MVGCGGSIDTGNGEGNPTKGSPTTPYDTAADDGTQPSHVDPASRSVQAESFRDYAAFSYLDRYGNQKVSQWLVSDDGTGYFTRACSIGDRGGVDWRSCSTWSWNSQPVVEMGVGQDFASISGMSAYTYNTVINGKQLQQVAQTVFDEHGVERRGRVCTVNPEATNAAEPWLKGDCTDWEKLQTYSFDFGVAGVESFRDDFMFSFTNTNGDQVFSQTLLGNDGSLTWSRSCVTPNAEPFPSISCRFGDSVSVTALGSVAAAIGGHGAFTYLDNGQPMIQETVISVDGARSQHRSCALNDKGIDLSSCTVWASYELSTLHSTQGAL